MAKKVIAGQATVVIGISDRISRGAAGVKRSLSKIAATTGIVGTAMLGLGLAASTGLGAAMTRYAEFDDQVKAVGAVTKATAGELAGLREQAEKLGATTSFTATEVAGLQAELGRAGFDPGQIENMTAAVLDLARATGIEAPEAAGIASATLRQFGLEADQAARVADVLTNTANSTFNTITSLGEAMKFAAPTAADLGLSLEETAAIVGTLGNVGVQGSMAGTAIRRLATIGAAEADRLGKVFGVSLRDAQGESLPLIETLGRIQEATNKLGKTERIEKLNDGFGLLGITAASALGKMSASVKDLVKANEQSANVSAETAAKMDSGIGGSFRMLESAIDGLVIAISSALEPLVVGLVDKFTRLVSVTSNWIKENEGLAKAVFAIVGAIGVAGAGLVAFATGVVGLGVAISAAGTVFGALKATVLFLAGPAAPVVLGLAAAGAAAVALGAGITAVIHRMGKLGDIFTWAKEKGLAAFKGISDAVGDISDALTSGDFETAFQLLVQHAKLGFFEFAREGIEAVGAIADHIPEFLSTALDMLVAAAPSFAKALRMLMNPLGATASAIAALKDGLSMSLNDISFGIGTAVVREAEEAREEIKRLNKLIADNNKERQRQAEIAAKKRQAEEQEKRDQQLASERNATFNLTDVELPDFLKDVDLSVPLDDANFDQFKQSLEQSSAALLQQGNSTEVTRRLLEKLSGKIETTADQAEELGSVIAGVKAPEDQTQFETRAEFDEFRQRLRDSVIDLVDMGHGVQDVARALIAQADAAELSTKQRRDVDALIVEESKKAIERIKASGEDFRSPDIEIDTTAIDQAMNEVGQLVEQARKSRETPEIDLSGLQVTGPELDAREFNDFVDQLLVGVDELHSQDVSADLIQEAIVDAGNAFELTSDQATRLAAIIGRLDSAAFPAPELDDAAFDQFASQMVEAGQQAIAQGGTVAQAADNMLSMASAQELSAERFASALEIVEQQSLAAAQSLATIDSGEMPGTTNETVSVQIELDKVRDALAEAREQRVDGGREIPSVELPEVLQGRDLSIPLNNPEFEELQKQTLEQANQMQIAGATAEETADRLRNMIVALSKTETQSAKLAELFTTITQQDVSTVFDELDFREFKESLADSANQLAGAGKTTREVMEELKSQIGAVNLNDEQRQELENAPLELAVQANKEQQNKEQAEAAAEQQNLADEQARREAVLNELREAFIDPRAEAIKGIQNKFNDQINAINFEELHGLAPEEADLLRGRAEVERDADLRDAMQMGTSISSLAGGFNANAAMLAGQRRRTLSPEMRLQGKQLGELTKIRKAAETTAKKDNVARFQ